MLTERQQEYLTCIEKLVAENQGLFPTIRQIQDGMGLAAPSAVQQAITHLIIEGSIEMIGTFGEARRYRLVPKCDYVQADNQGRKLPKGSQLFYWQGKPVGYFMPAEVLPVDITGSFAG